MKPRLSPRRQGDIGEAAAIWWLTSVGATVSRPLCHSPDYDLVAELGGRLLRVQVKTSTFRRGAAGFVVALATSGGNQSWNGVTTYFGPERCDALFVLVADGRRWFIPATAVEGRSNIVVGGAKYARFEIDPRGAPAFLIGPALESNAPRGSSDDGESGRTVNPVPLAQWVRIPPPPSAAAAGGEPAQADGATIPVRRRRDGRTRVSPKHQITIPIGPLTHAGLTAGDALRAEAVAAGEIRLTRLPVAATAEGVTAANSSS